MRCVHRKTLLGIVALFYAFALPAVQTSPLTVGEKLQVFWDDLIVDVAQTTAKRVAHRPEYAGVIFESSMPWEGDGGSYGSVVKVGETWRMYRQFCKMCETSPYYTGLLWGLLESRDGISWNRAAVNRHLVMGLKENNIILDEDANFWDNFMVFRDTNPACPVNERYKAISLFDHKWTEQYAQKYPDYASLAKAGRALWCFVSADGLDFKPGWKLFSVGDYGLRFDSLNVAFWDPVRREYRMYMRSIRKIKMNRYGCQFARWIKFSASKDFRKWSEPIDIEFDDGMEEFEHYTSNVDLYPRNPELVVGFPTRYVDRKKWDANFDLLPDREKRLERMGKDPRHGLAISDCLFMWSRDGKTFRHEEDAFLAPGPECAGNWIYGNGFPVRGFVLSPGRFGDDPEYSFYVKTGGWSGKWSKIHRYALRQDGFVSYHGRYRTEKLVTRGIVFAGNEMLVNFRTSGGGRMFVTIRNEKGESIRTCEMFGDKVDRVAAFDKDAVAAFAGKPVVVEFELSDADIYSFRFRNSPQRAYRPVDSPELARRAETYEQDVFSIGVSNMADRVRIPLLGALNMKYRTTGSQEAMARAQRIFAVLDEADRRGAPAKDEETDLWWLAVADAHFAMAKDVWPIRVAVYRSKNPHPARYAYQWKYQHNAAAKAALTKMNVPAEDIPGDEGFFSDRLAMKAIGAADVKDAVTRLTKVSPKSADGKAKWLWAYWTARRMGR